MARRRAEPQRRQHVRERPARDGRQRELRRTHRQPDRNAVVAAQRDEPIVQDTVLACVAATFVNAEGIVNAWSIEPLVGLLLPHSYDSNRSSIRMGPLHASIARRGPLKERILQIAPVSNSVTENGMISLTGRGSLLKDETDWTTRYRAHIEDRRQELVALLKTLEQPMCLRGAEKLSD